MSGHQSLYVGVSLFTQVSVYLQNWSHVLSYVNKAESTPEIAEVSIIVLDKNVTFKFCFKLLIPVLMSRFKALMRKCTI